MALDATVGGAASNAYADVTYADAFFANRFDKDDWDAVIDQDLALMQATSEFEMYDPVYGERVSTTQLLQYPRYNVPKRDSAWYVNYYLSTEIPKPLKDATCLRALSIATASAFAASSGSGSSQTLKIGSSVTYETKVESSSSSSSTSSGGILGEASRLLKGLLKGTAGIPMMRA